MQLTDRPLIEVAAYWYLWETHRIIGLDNGGAWIKNVKTGDETSVSYEHIRKINLNELLALLPQNFDAEIMGALETYRYKSSGKGGKDETDAVRKEDEKEDETGKRRLRSGRLYKVSVDKLSRKSEAETEVAYWRKDKIYKRDTRNDQF